MLLIGKKLNELYDKMVVKDKKMDKERQENARQLAANKKLFEELEEKQKELSLLEKKHKDIDDVLNARQEAKDILAQSNTAKRKNAADRDAISKERDAMMKEVQAERDTVNSRAAKLKKGELALDKERKEYKEKVMDSITKELKGKGIKL